MLQPMSHPTDRPPPEVPTRPGWVPREPIPDPGGRPDWAVPAALLATAVVYPAAFWLRVVPLWPALAALAAVSWWAAWHPYLRVRLGPTWRLAAAGAASGLALYALCLAGALVARETPLWPGIQDVAGLARRGAPLGVAAVAAVLGVAPGEEVLWRGAMFARATRRLGAGWRPVAEVTATYAAFVALSGSLALVLAAVVCGAVWARQRQVTGSLVPGVVSHAVWALLVLLYLPGPPAA
jgi:membrane protease YdiL (CAAX protease family)